MSKQYLSLEDSAAYKCTKLRLIGHQYLRPQQGRNKHLKKITLNNPSRCLFSVLKDVISN